MGLRPSVVWVIHEWVGRACGRAREWLGGRRLRASVRARRRLVSACVYAGARHAPRVRRSTEYGKIFEHEKIRPGLLERMPALDEAEYAKLSGGAGAEVRNRNRDHNLQPKDKPTRRACCACVVVGGRCTATWAWQAAASL